MRNGENELQSVDIEKIRAAIKLHTPIEITTFLPYFLPKLSLTCLMLSLSGKLHIAATYSL